MARGVSRLVKEGRLAKLPAAWADQERRDSKRY